MDTLKRGGPVRRRFALVAFTAAAVAGATVIVPTAADAVTAYFSRVVTVKVAIDITNNRTPNGNGWKTAWCPIGYKVTGGGFDLLDDDGAMIIRGSTPTANSSGRQGWRIRYWDLGAGDTGPPLYVYAQCVR